MRISAIIPSYNYAAFVSRAMESVVRQTHACELVVVDDGSTDDTKERVREQMRRSDGIEVRYVKQSNAGPSAARNHGARLARGDWIAFLDADDYWYDDKLERQIRFAARYPQAGLYFGGVEIENAQGRLRRVLPLSEGYLETNALLRENWIPSPTPLLNKELFFQAGAFDESRRLAEDWDMWLRLSERAPIAGMRESLGVYSDHGRGLHANVAMREAGWQVLAQAIVRRRNRLSKHDINGAFSHWAILEATQRLSERNLHAFASAAKQAWRLSSKPWLVPFRLGLGTIRALIATP